jgi:hypothetical protein
MNPQMRTTFKTAALLIAAFSIPQLANAGIIWDMTGMGKSLAESKLRGEGAEESHLTNLDNGPSSSQNNNNENNNDGDDGNHYAYGNENDNGNKNDNNADETVVVDEQFTEAFVPVVPVETVTEPEPVSVPEPMSLVLFATGLLAAAAIARRKSA